MLNYESTRKSNKVIYGVLGALAITCGIGAATATNVNASSCKSQRVTLHKQTVKRVFKAKRGDMTSKIANYLGHINNLNHYRWSVKASNGDSMPFHHNPKKAVLTIKRSKKLNTPVRHKFDFAPVGIYAAEK